jgi:bifunctional polynucleotide phosphatase/kinase
MELDNGWIEHKGVLIRTPCVARGEPKMTYNSKVAAFSFNNCIVKTKSGNKIPSNRYDVDWWCDLVVIKLSELNSDGYSLVVINDETDVEKGNLTRDDCRSRFDWFAASLYKKGIPVIGLFSLESNCLRKPYTAMWQILKSMCKGWQINSAESMYAGADGARVADKVKHLKADTGYKDRAFAINNGLVYHSPDELFRKHTPRDWKFPENVLSGEDKKVFLQISSDMERNGPLAKYGNKFSVYVDSIVSEQKFKNAIILLVGQRSSGKTTIANKIVSEDSRFKMYERGKQKIGKFLKTMALSIEMGDIPVIDGPTFASKASRSVFVDFAQEKHIPLIIISVITPYKLCLFYDRMKVARDFDVEPIKMLQYKKFKADYQAPKSDHEEGVYVIEWPLIINVEKEFWLTL